MYERRTISFDNEEIAVTADAEYTVLQAAINRENCIIVCELE